MRRFDRVLVVSPHADDEVLGCGGLLAALRRSQVPVHVVYLAIDGMEHYGLAKATTFRERLGEVERVADLLGFGYSIAYPDQGLTERLDTVPLRELVDLVQTALDQQRPDLLLLPAGSDYDQDHVACHRAGFAAARPIGSGQFGKWLVPDVWSYEMSKIQWADAPLPRFSQFVDITDDLDAKLAALRLYASQYRPAPHIRSEESVTALATLRGAEAGTRFAEAFSVHRSICRLRSPEPSPDP